jgi:hypothetical protein
VNLILGHLLEFIEAQPVINTHSHQDMSLEAGGFDLEKCFRNSYVAWCGVMWEPSAESRARLLREIRFNSYFVWLERALQALHGLDGPLSAANWERVSGRVRAAHQEPGYWVDLLRRRCGYEQVVEDAYWDPGSDNGLPGLFRPAFRVNSFFFGYSPQARDHDGNNALSLYRAGQPVDTFDGYLAFASEQIMAERGRGCVALKLPIAYDRGLDFRPVSKAEAQAAFNRLTSAGTPADVTAFQDYLAFFICNLASEVGLPVQVHTGMGKLERSNALWLKPLIQACPETRFVLLHCGSPWTEDVLALVRSYANLYPDLSWLPQLTFEGARRMLHDLIEAGAEHKAAWGCDTWTPEESYGSLLAFRQVLATVLAEKAAAGYLSEASAREVARQILSDNARELYNLTPAGMPASPEPRRTDGSVMPGDELG